jgi:hypothetical protein
MTNKALFITVLLSFAMALPRASECGDEQPLKRPFFSGDLHVVSFQNPRIRESSGLASSGLNREVIWTHNDSGNGPELFAVDRNGEDLGVFQVTGANNRDWEDLASFRWEGRSCLLAADVGDNGRSRKSCTLYVVIEPEINMGHVPIRDSVPLFREIPFRYEDGPHNCEAVAVDRVNRQVLLVTKGDVPPRVYALPLDPGGGEEGHVARPIARVPHVREPGFGDRYRDKLKGPSGARPTAMDLSPDGSLALILTYRYAYIFRKHRGEGWKKALTGRPQILDLPELDQAEGACFDHDGQGIFVSSEKGFPFSLPGF